MEENPKPPRGGEGRAGSAKGKAKANSDILTAIEEAGPPTRTSSKNQAQISLLLKDFPSTQPESSSSKKAEKKVVPLLNDSDDEEQELFSDIKKIVDSDQQPPESLTRELARQSKTNRMRAYLAELDQDIAPHQVIIADPTANQWKEQQAAIEDTLTKATLLDTELTGLRKTEAWMQEQKLKEKIFQEKLKYQQKHQKLDVRKREQLAKLSAKSRKDFKRNEDRVMSKMKKHDAELVWQRDAVFSRRRWKLKWSKEPQIVDIKIRQLRAVKNKLPEGEYALMVSLYNQLGGDPILYTKHWSKPKKSTRAVQHHGRFDDVSMIFNERLRVQCPASRYIHPRLVFIFELMCLRVGNRNVHDIVGWAVFPAVNSDLRLVTGKFKTGLVRGSYDKGLDKYGKIAEIFSEDLEYWLANLYFEVHYLQRPHPTQNLEFALDIKPLGSIGAEKRLRSFQPDSRRRSVQLNVNPTSVSDGGDAYPTQFKILDAKRGDIELKNLKEVKIDISEGESTEDEDYDDYDDDDEYEEYYRARKQEEDEEEGEGSYSDSDDDDDDEESKRTSLLKAPPSLTIEVPKPSTSASASAAADSDVKDEPVTSPVDQGNSSSPLGEVVETPISAGSGIQFIKNLFSSTQNLKKRVQFADPSASQALSRRSSRDEPQQDLETTDASTNSEAEGKLKLLASETTSQPALASVASALRNAYDSDAAKRYEIEESHVILNDGDQVVLDQFKTSVFVEAKVWNTTNISKQKLLYLRKSLEFDLGFNNVSRLEFWGMLLFVIFVFYIRLWPHYVGSWLWLKSNNIPVLKEEYGPLGAHFEIRNDFFSLLFNIIYLSMGTFFNITLFLIMIVITIIGQKLIKAFPVMGSRFVLLYGIATVLDPLLILAVDLATQNWRGESFRLGLYYEVTEKSSIPGAIMTALVYFQLIAFSGIILYNFMIHIFMNGRLLDVFQRLNKYEHNTFFLPHDLEVPPEAVKEICQKAMYWTNEEGSARIVLVDGIEEDVRATVLFHRLRDLLECSWPEEYFEVATMFDDDGVAPDIVESAQSQSPALAEVIREASLRFKETRRLVLMEHFSETLKPATWINERSISTINRNKKSLFKHKMDTEGRFVIQDLDCLADALQWELSSHDDRLDSTITFLLDYQIIDREDLIRFEQRKHVSGWLLRPNEVIYEDLIKARKPKSSLKLAFLEFERHFFANQMNMEVAKQRFFTQRDSFNNLTTLGRNHSKMLDSVLLKKRFGYNSYRDVETQNNNIPSNQPPANESRRQSIFSNGDDDEQYNLSSIGESSDSDDCPPQEPSTSQRPPTARYRKSVVIDPHETAILIREPEADQPEEDKSPILLKRNSSRALTFANQLRKSYAKIDVAAILQHKRLNESMASFRGFTAGGKRQPQPSMDFGSRSFIQDENQVKNAMDNFMNGGEMHESGRAGKHLVIFQVSFDGNRKVHRHFVRCPNGAILEVFDKAQNHLVRVNITSADSYDYWIHKAITKLEVYGIYA